MRPARYFFVIQLSNSRVSSYLKLSEKYVDKSLNFITKFCIGGFGGLRKNPGKKVDFP